MRHADFEAMVRRMADDVPAEYLEGVADVVVSRKTVPHPARADIWTMGECIPLPALDADPDTIQSRVVLYYGSFAALAAADPDFDWREEAWETLTHELRHHLEWRARAPDLEALDRAVEANYARQDGEPFDPLFYRDGESPAPGVYRVEDDYFLEHTVREVHGPVVFRWHGCAWRCQPPQDVTLPAFLELEGVADPPPGSLTLVLLRRGRWRDLFRAAPEPYQGKVTAVRVGG